MERDRDAGDLRCAFSIFSSCVQVLFKTGHAEMATMMFEMALEENVSGEETTGVSNGLLDLHNHTASTAL